MDSKTPGTPDPIKDLYDQEFNNGAGQNLSEEDREDLGIVGANKAKDDRQRLQDKEQNPSNFGAGDDTQEGGFVNRFTGNNSPRSRFGRAKAAFVANKRKSIVAGVVTGGALGLGMGGMFFGGTLAPIMAVQAITDDLNDRLSALEVRAGKITRLKVLSNPASLGCKGSLIPIKCKYRTMSEKMVERYKAAGIEVKGETGGDLGKRVRPTEIIFQGKSYSPQEFWDATHSRSAKYDVTSLRNASKAALNMKFLSLNGPNFVRKTLKRFGVSLAPPELTGSHQDRVNRLMGRVGTANIGDISFSLAFNDDGSPTLDSNGEQMWVQDGDPTSSPITEGTKNSLEKSVGRMKILKKPITQNALRGLNILGNLDLACTIKNTIGAAAMTQKVMNEMQLIGYALPVASLAGAMQASEISPENGQVLQEFFNTTDARESLAGVVQGESSKDAKEEEVPNPNYGKNAMDSELIKMSTNGGVAHTSLADASYSLGFGLNSLASKAASFARVADKIDSFGTDFISVCGAVQSWWVRGGGMLVGLGVGIFSGGASIAGSTLASAPLIILSMAAEQLLGAALSSTLITEAIIQAPVERGSAFWTGLAASQSRAALSSGMMPGNAEQIVAYQLEQSKVKQEYLAYERQQSNPLDFKNPYSLAGTTALAIHDRIPSTISASSIASLPTNISSFVFGGIASVLKPYSAHAAALDPARFEQCDDKGYEDVGISADVQCNVRYVMPAESMQLDPLEVAEYMEGNNPEGIQYVEPDTTTGLPEGYSTPDPEQNQNIAKQFVMGQVNSIYNTRNYVNDYGKFLDFCVYRTLPFGEVYDDDAGAFGAAGEDWANGKNCMRTDNEAINYFRMYVFDMSTNDDLDESPLTGDPSCGSGGNGTSGPNSTTVEAINARIEASEKNNGWAPGTSPLGGKGQAFIDLGQQYGINPGVAVAILQRESQLGTAKNDVLVPQNNFGGNSAIPGSVEGDCGVWPAGSELFANRKWKKFCTPEAGLEGLFQNLDAAIYRNTDGTLGAVMEIYAPRFENDWGDMLSIFNAVGEGLGMTIDESTQIYTSGGSGGGNTNCRTAAGGGAGFTAIWGGEPKDPRRYAFGVDSANGLYGYGTDYGLNGLAHTGIDVVLPPEAPLYSPVSGTITCAGTGNGPGAGGRGCTAFNDYLGKGNGHIQIELDNKDVLILGHTSTSLVSVGDRVTPGQQVGTNGGMNGWHVHIEYRTPNTNAPSGYKIVDPEEYLGGVVN